MDLPNTDCAGESNAQKVPQRRLKRKTLAELPVQPSSSHTKENKHTESTTVCYKIKGILSERKFGKTTEFLIDWEDNPVTGEIYEPSWEPYSNVTPVAIYEWENTQAIRAYNSQSQNTTSQDSEPIRPPKRRRTNNPGAPVSLEKGQVQIPNTATGGSVVSKNKVQEIKDSYEDEDSSFGDRLSIVIPPNKDINPEEYTVVRSSQLSNYSNSQANLQSSSPLQVQQAPPDSQIVIPRKRSAPAFIWDEDIVPESQYSTGSNPYKSSFTRSASDCEEDVQSVQPEISDRVRKGITRSSPEAIITQHTDTVHTVDTVTVATKSKTDERQQEDFSNNINQIPVETFEKSSIPDSYIIDHNSSLIDLIPAQSAPQVSLTLTLTPTPKPQQHLRSQPSQVSTVSGLSPATKTPLPESQQSFDRPPEEAEKSDYPQKHLQLQSSLEIPDSYLVSDPFTKRLTQLFSSQGVDVHIDSQYRASSLPTNQSQTKTVLSDSQRSQSLPSATRVNSSSEETWQAAQIVTQVPRTPSQELYREKSHSQGSKDHVQIDNSQISDPTHPKLSDRRHLTSSVSEDHRVRNNSGIGAEVPEIQPSASKLSAGAASIQVLASIADLHNAQLQSLKPQSSQNLAELAWSSSSDLPPRPSPHSLVKMSTLGSGASYLAVDERRARSTKSRSPLTIPPRVATAPPAPSNNHPLPMRDSIADTTRPRNMAPSIPRSSVEESADTNPDILTVRKLGRNEFIIPLPMMTQVRDVYDTTIKNKKNDIMSFVGGSIALDSESMDMMLEELKLICDHQDLIVEESSTQNLDDSAQARYAVTISTKFLFIQQFLSSLRVTKVHVVILARDAILPILEALFRSQNFYYNRPDMPGNMSENLGKSEEDMMQITLLPTWIDVRDCIVAPASVVVAFDSSFSASQGEDEHYQALPFDPRNPDKRAPLLWLVITNSVEHVELCIPTTLESSERKDRLVQYVARTRKVVGLLDTSIYPDPEVAARGAAEYVLDDSLESEWSLLPMPNIDVSLPNHGANNRLSNSLTQSLFSPLEPNNQSGFKRPSNFDAVDEDIVIKRQRMTPTRQGREPDSNIMNGTIVEYQKKIKSLYDRCEDNERSINRIQPKFQRALDDRARFEHENAQAVKRQAECEKKMEVQDEAAAKLREENASLKNEVAVARNSLATSEIPSIAEIQKAKDDLRTAQAEIERLKKGQTSAEKRADYAASIYQESSQQAQEMRNELATLHSERKELRHQASAARIEIQKINHDGIIQQQCDTIDELKRELAERERMLERVTGQLDAYMNGRRTTRGTSVPRSPRVNNMSPRPRVLGNMAPGSNTASRGNSPTPGLFGGELFQGNDTGKRFGAHLQ
ncbi:hypothetical protein SBOR_6511 [Sclerotinia borealis F-4128]|uniref:Chromo domain-containing protein n=1 Tax=Sclerotinia borealis (strain F-4128) TaxID=1432307 RepID=W9CB57_SCLBF|nr:hypothetical protein SBOR_6511 [Sclerotinia borealis F-4128]